MTIDPAVRCPLCNLVVKIVPSGNYCTAMIEKHNWSGLVGDLVDLIGDSEQPGRVVQWLARCPMSEAPAEKK